MRRARIIALVAVPVLLLGAGWRGGVGGGPAGGPPPGGGAGGGVSGGGAALAAVRGLRRGAVVLDVGLPKLDGIEVCRALRSADDWTPVLFVTARDDEVDRVLGLELGADDYVKKPFTPREPVAP